MAFRLLLLRHGETAWNRERRFQGSKDVSLSTEGRIQSEAAARALVNDRPAAVYASPLARARETAEIVAKPHALAVMLEPAFAEMCFGVWEGLTPDEVTRAFPDLYRTWRSEPHRLACPDGETLASVRARAMRGIEELRERHEGDTAFLISHGVVVRLIVLDALGLPPDRLWAVHADPVGITELEYLPEWTTVHRMNTRQHLESAHAP